MNAFSRKLFTLITVVALSLTCQESRAWMTSSLIAGRPIPSLEGFVPPRIFWKRRNFIQAVQKIATQLKHLHISQSNNKPEVNFRRELMLRVM